MHELDYVSDEAAERAREWERRFQQLPPSAGVLFVSVAASPAPRGECRTYEVRLGIQRGFEEATGIALIRHVLAAEIESGRFQIRGAAYRGVAGAARSEDHPRPGSHPS
jgi:hypothetical protein